MCSEIGCTPITDGSRSDPGLRLIDFGTDSVVLNNSKPYAFSTTNIALKAFRHRITMPPEGNRMEVARRVSPVFFSGELRPSFVSLLDLTIPPSRWFRVSSLLSHAQRRFGVGRAARAMVSFILVVARP